MNNKLILFLILLIAIILRFYDLGNTPPSPDWDEAALGYNAYSILKTGRDEYGVFMPAVLRSFDDYKPPLYMYLAVPSVAVFGLNIWAVRLPAAIVGSLAVIGVYFLVSEFLKFIEKKDQARFGALPFLVMVLFAVSPWHVHFSRIAFEANIGVAINIWMLVFFFWGLRRNPRWFYASAIVASLSLYAYHSERIFMPLLVLLLFAVFRKELKTYSRQLCIGVVLGCIVILPLVIVFLDPVNWTRLKGTSSLSDTTRLLERSSRKLLDDQSSGDWLGMIFDNRRIVYIQKLAEGYLSHFSVKWLFLTGDNDRHHAPDMGLLYLIELPFLLYGMYRVWRKGGILSKFLFAWFLIAPIAASPTNETPHAIRTLVFLPVFQIFIAIGILEIIMKTKHGFFWNLARLAARQGFVFLYFISIVYYLHMYFGHMNIEYSFNWQYGYEEVVDYVKSNGGKYTKVVVSTKLEQPHMFFLFYLKYDPVKYLEEGGTASGGFAEDRNHFGKYSFRPLVWDDIAANGSTLYIGTPGEIPDNNTLYKIFYLNGDEAIRIGA